MEPTILYVDDDTSNLTVFEATCCEEFDVVVASSAPEGIRLLEDMPHIAVLVADQRMPGMTGVEMCERVSSSHPHVVRMLMTAYADLDATVDAINRGQVSRYIRKPWEPVALKATLRDALELTTTRRRIQQLERRFVETERTYALGVIAAGFAHEVRNPLGTVVLSQELAQHWIETLTSSLRSPGFQPEEGLRCLQKIDESVTASIESARRIREITEAIDLSHRRTGTQNTAAVPRLVEMTLSLVRPTLMGKATVEVAIDSVPDVVGSPSKLGQVVMNLIVNAAEALPTSTANENVIRVTVGRDGGMVRLDVADNGSGIAPDTLERIFDPFFTTKDDGGTGLGLAISKTIVEEAGGTLTVESREGHGACFTVRLKPAR